MNKSLISLGAIATLLPLAAQTQAAKTAAADAKAGIASRQSRPNILVLLADDLGFGDVSAYGSKTISTPNIDALARGGVCFNNGYATSATSTPSRYGLMTGMYPWKNDEAKILPGDAPLIINEHSLTLPRMMQQEGYVTGAIGKWHLGMGRGNVDWNTRITPGANEIGFDYSCLAAATNDRVPTVFVENGRVVNLDPNDPIYVSYEKNFDGEPTALDHPEMLKMHWAHGHNNSIVNGIPRIGYMKGGKAARWIDEDIADYYVGKVKDFLRDNKDRPFFLYYGLHQPHVPRTPHQRFVGATTMGPRGDAIAECDWCVGEVMDELKRLGLLDNTLVIFTSDNGPVLNDGYKDQAAELAGDHKPAGGLRGGKYSLYDGGSHVPFFVYWKGHIRPTVSDALVCQIDLMPSIGALIGRKVAGLDGQNLLPVFMGKKGKGRKSLVFEAQGKMGLRAGDWIMIPPYSGPQTNLTGNELGNLSAYGLFNVRKDPQQRDNVAPANGSRLESLKRDFFATTKGYYKAQVDEVELK